MQKKIILLAGPTASGKSNLAILLAKKIKGEIINTDSMQVYKEFLILSSRPSKNDLKKVSHHLYGFLSVKKNFSTGEWLKLVKKKIYQITKKKRIPILVGGTGLYFNAITKGISKIPVISDKYRETIRANHKLIGQKKFYEKLIELDPLSQKNISPNDTQRSIRAYEVKFFTGKSLYEWISKTKSDFIDYDIRKIYLDTPRDVLLKKIEHRTNKMFKENCAKEVKNFLSLNIKKSLSANKIIGLNEIRDFLTGKKSKKDTIELINIKTRQYAKRQNTWSRGHMTNWKKLYNKDFSILLKKILKQTS